jgi:hypothetical protein
MTVSDVSVLFSLEAMRQYAALILHVSITILYSWDNSFDSVYLPFYPYLPLFTFIYLLRGDRAPRSKTNFFEASSRAGFFLLGIQRIIIT